MNYKYKRTKPPKASNKILELAKKLKALADRGVGGEATNAQMFLKRIIDKYQLNPSLFETEKKKEHTFTVTRITNAIFVQICVMVAGSDTKVWNYKRFPTLKYLECTEFEALEIASMYEFYKKDFEQQLELFKNAYIQTNKLFPKDVETTDIHELNDEEREKVMKELRMAGGISKANYRKELKA